ARHRPEAACLDVKRQDGIAGGAGQPDGPGLRDSRRPPRTVEGKAHRPSFRKVAAHLNKRTCRAARGRAARHTEPKTLDDTRDPLAVEVLARHHDDAAMAEVVDAAEDSAVPERHDRLPS